MENLVGYAKTDLMVPGDGEPSVADLAAANAAAAAWCAEVNAAVHSRDLRGPGRAAGRSSGSCWRRCRRCGPSIGAKPITRKVDRLSCVRFGSARYSVPNRLIGTVVLITVAEGRVQVLEPVTGEVVAEHALVAPGEASIVDEHYGGPRRTSRGGRRGPRPRRRRGSARSGEVAAAFLTGAAAAGVTNLARRARPDPHPARRPRRRRRCSPRWHRAVAFGRWRAADVRSILAAAGAAPQPDAGRGGAGARPCRRCRPGR